MTKVKIFFNFWKFELGLLASFSFLYFIILPFVPIIDGDTFFYIARAKKILITGDWLNLQSLMSKPFLGIWCLALSYKLFGISLFSTYFWHTLFGLGTLLVVYFFALEFAGRQTARIAAAVLLTSLMFFYQVCSPMLDIPMIFFLALSHWFLYKYIYHGRPLYLYLTAAAAGLNFLTKGFLGAALPAITFVLYLVFTRTNPFKEYRHFLLHTFFAIAVFTAIISIWVLPQYKVYGQEFFQSWYRENIVRFFKPIDETGGYRHVSADVQHDPQVNIIYIFLSLLPWAPFLMPAMIKGFRDRKFFAKPELTVFLLCWFLFVAFITTISGHYKGPRYLLPFFPAAALLFSLYLAPFLNNLKLKDHQKLIYRSFIFFSTTLGLIILTIIFSKFQHGEEQYRPFILTFLGFYLFVHCYAAFCWKKARYTQAVYGLIIFSLLSYTIFLVQGTAYIKKIYPDYVVSHYLKNYPKQKIVVWKIKIRSLDFYLNRHINYIQEEHELKNLSGRFLLVLEKDQLEKIKEFKPKHLLNYDYGNWLVLQF